MAKKTPQTVGERLKFAREMAGLSTRQLDRHAAITPGHTWFIEAGTTKNMETRTAERLAGVLGLSLDWLVLGRGDAPTEESIKRAVARAEKSANNAAE